MSREVCEFFVIFKDPAEELHLYSICVLQTPGRISIVDIFLTILIISTFQKSV